MKSELINVHQSDTSKHQRHYKMTINQSMSVRSEIDNNKKNCNNNN